MSHGINGYDIIKKESDGQLYFVGCFDFEGNVNLIKYEEGKVIDVHDGSLKSTIKNSELVNYTVHRKCNSGYGGN